MDHLRSKARFRRFRYIPVSSLQPAMRAAVTSCLRAGLAAGKGSSIVNHELQPTRLMLFDLVVMFIKIQVIE